MDRAPRVWSAEGRPADAYNRNALPIVIVPPDIRTDAEPADGGREVALTIGPPDPRAYGRLMARMRDTPSDPREAMRDLLRRMEADG